MKPRNKKIDFILASASPRRRHLLTRAGYSFLVIPSHASERAPAGLTPAALVRHLALKKARAVSVRHPRRIVLGADTLVFVKGRVIGKPRHQPHAVKILKTLSGSWQRVLTGVAVVVNGGAWEKTGVGISSVKFKRLTDAEIKRASHRHLDKAGAYSIQHKGDSFVEILRGDYDNVVGLPVKKVRQLLRSARQALLKSLRHHVHAQG